MKPIACAFAVVLLFGAVVRGLALPGNPARTGQTSFAFNGAKTTFDKVDGIFNKSYGCMMVSLNFSKTGKPGAGDALTISLMIQKAGLVNLKQPGNGIGYRKAGSLFTSDNARSQCSMNVTQITNTSVAGAAACTQINEMKGPGVATLKAVRFTASTQ